MRQQLENIEGIYQPRVSQERQQTYFVVGDLESLSASVLYDGDEIIRKSWGMIVPLKINKTSIHDTYKYDKSGNLSSGHSTVNLPNNGKVYMPHSITPPSIKPGS